MSVSYYPWNVSALADWLHQELSRDFRLRELANKMQIPPHMITRWTKEHDPYITFKHLQGIARFKGWSLEQTAAWLEINSAHWQTLLEEDRRLS